jgi:glycosyltransferase involved in cell wall biosynthesis
VHAGPALSVVIPCRNGAAVLPRQLGALASQEWSEPWEVIVVDNASSDDTAAVAARWADRLPSLRVLRASRRGRQHACNVGARAAARAAVFVDADDEVAPGFVRAVGEALACHPIVVVAAEAAGGGGPQAGGLRDELGFLPWGQGGTIGVQRRVFDALGGFGDAMRYAEDVDFCWRAQLAGYALHFVPEARVRWHPRPSFRGAWRQYRDYGRGQAMLYRRYRGRGMPRRAATQALREWAGLARSAPVLRTQEQRSRWVRRLARDVGRLQGSLRYGVWYP